MRRLLSFIICTVLLTACMSTRPALKPLPWEQRLLALQQAGAWQLDGRAAVAAGSQGWQASLNWHQLGMASEVHLAGPLGVGALVLKQTPEGLSLNGAPPSDAVIGQLQERLGFALPLDHLRFWLLGVPDPDSDTAFDLRRNDRDRAQQLTQDGWSIDYDRYLPVNGDWLPAHLVLSREGVRVRIAVDHWTLLR
jgi:outer membrane lipoprotein LolB